MYVKLPVNRGEVLQPAPGNHSLIRHGFILRWETATT